MTKLSPAALAVWEAFNQDEAGVFVNYGDKLIAALRAATGKVPAPNYHEEDAFHDKEDAFHAGFWAAIEYVQSIADELEAQ